MLVNSIGPLFSMRATFYFKKHCTVYVLYSTVKCIIRAQEISGFR